VYQIVWQRALFVIYLNSTQSTAAQKIVAAVFPLAVRFQNMMIAAYDSIEIDRERWRDKLVPGGSAVSSWSTPTSMPQRPSRY
jgi:hypothetical protein